MNNTMEYKGYIGSVEFSEVDGVFFGKVQGIRSLISYEGTTARELVDDFHSAVEDYLAFIRRKETSEDSKKRCFAAAGRTEKRNEFVLVNIQVDAAKYKLSVKFLDDVSELNQFLRCRTVIVRNVQFAAHECLLSY